MNKEIKEIYKHCNSLSRQRSIELLVFTAHHFLKRDYISREAASIIYKYGKLPPDERLREIVGNQA